MEGVVESRHAGEVESIGLKLEKEYEFSDVQLVGSKVFF